MQKSRNRLGNQVLLTSPPWLPPDGMDRFHLLIWGLHTAGAVGAFFMSMYCEVLPATQQAMLPSAIRVPTSGKNGTILVQSQSPQGNFSAVRAYLAAFPWSEDEVFHTHLWNPYLLIVAFEWLTAAFAMCNLWRWWPEVRIWCPVWTGVGLVGIIMWCVRHYAFEADNPKHEFAASMTIILVISYAITAALTYMYITKVEATRLIGGYEKTEAGDDNFQQHNPEVIPAPPSGPGGGGEPQDAAPLTVTRRIVMQGRTWRIPTQVHQLKTMSTSASSGRYSRNISQQGTAMLEDDLSMRGFLEAVSDVFFRYCEYCITAPLLFLAIMCLLTVDPPAWLFLFGYWLIQACNAIGIAYHATICTDLIRDYSKDEEHNGAAGAGGEGSTNIGKPGGAGSVLEWMKGLFAAGAWGDRGMQHVYLLMSSWLCLLIPMGGLVYMTRSWLFSFDNMPWIAIMMVWLLFVSYSMFGVVPTVVYSYYRRDMIQKLPWILDSLNLVAKFPVPILIFIAFVSRPAGFHACSSS